MYRLTILSIWRNPLITPLVPKFLSLTWNHSFLCGAILVHPGPRLLVNWPTPSPFPPYSLFPPPTVPQSSYAPSTTTSRHRLHLVWNSILWIYVYSCILTQINSFPFDQSNTSFNFSVNFWFLNNIVWLLLDSCLIIVQIMFDYCSIIVWLLFDYCLIIVQILFIILVLEMYSRYFDPVNT